MTGASSAIHIDARRGSAVVSLGLAHRMRLVLRGLDTRLASMIRIDAARLAIAPMDMRAGTETVLARVVIVFGAAHPQPSLPSQF